MQRASHVATVNNNSILQLTLSPVPQHAHKTQTVQNQIVQTQRVQTQIVQAGIVAVLGSGGPGDTKLMHIRYHPMRNKTHLIHRPSQIPLLPQHNRPSQTPLYTRTALKQPLPIHPILFPRASRGNMISLRRRQENLPRRHHS